MSWKFEMRKTGETGKDHKNEIQIRAVKGLAVFGVFMMLFTILSRAASNMTTPEVSVEAAKGGTLKYELRVTGTVEENQVQAVSEVPGIRVSKICVNSGDYVEKGTPLFEVDMEDLKEQIFLKKKELKKIDIGIRDIEERKKLEEQERIRSRERAREDYNRAAATGDEAVERTYTALIEAGNRLEEYRQQLQLQEVDGQQLEALEEALSQAQIAYEDALNQRDQSLMDAYRQIEDSEKPSSPDSSDQISKLDRKLLAMELDKLKALRKKRGVVCSAIQGVVMDIKIEAGSDTVDGQNMTIADLSSGSRFTAQITKEQQELVRKGEEAVLYPENSKNSITGLTIASVKDSSDNPQMLDVIVNIPDQQLEIGSRASLEIHKESGKYRCIIPIEALRFEDNGYFVLIPSETETILGSETIASKVEVQVLEKNDRMAALKDDALHGSQSIIVSSVKPVKAGDRICIKEE